MIFKSSDPMRSEKTELSVLMSDDNVTHGHALTGT